MVLENCEQPDCDRKCFSIIVNGPSTCILGITNEMVTEMILLIQDQNQPLFDNFSPPKITKLTLSIMGKRKLEVVQDSDSDDIMESLMSKPAKHESSGFYKICL